MLFNQTTGYQEIKEKLTSAVRAGRVPHASFFSGPEGSPVVPLALAYAQYLYCEDKRDDDSCGACHSCHVIQKLNHPDWHYLFPISRWPSLGSGEIASVTLALPQFRKFMLAQPMGSLNDFANELGISTGQPIINVADAKELQGELSQYAFEGGYKLAFIWLPETLGPAPANRLLKVLEEPHPKTVFLLAGYNADKMLPTILSRVQTVRVRPAEDEEIRDFLVEQEEVPLEQANRMAAAAEGSFVKAAELAGTDMPPFEDMFMRWMRATYASNLIELQKMAEEFAKLGKEPQKGMLLYSLSMLRQILRLQMGLEVAGAEKGGFLYKFATSLPAAGIEPMARQLERATYMVERNINPKLLFYVTSVKMVEMMGRQVLV